MDAIKLNIDLKILAICKKKRKLRQIKRIINEIRFDDEKKIFQIPSTDPRKPADFYYTVGFDIYNIGNKIKVVYNCSCAAKIYFEYKEGMKKYKQNNDCIHILAIKARAALKNS